MWARWVDLAPVSFESTKAWWTFRLRDRFKVNHHQLWRSCDLVCTCRWKYTTYKPVNVHTRIVYSCNNSDWNLEFFKMRLSSTFSSDPWICHYDESNRMWHDWSPNCHTVEPNADWQAIWLLLTHTCTHACRLTQRKSVKKLKLLQTKSSPSVFQ